MSTYTDVSTFERDVAPAGAGDQYARLLARGARMAYNYINARLNGIYTVPFSTTYPPLIVDISDLLTRCIARKLQAGNAPIIPKKVKRDGAQDECSTAVLMLDDLVSMAATLPGVPVLSGAAGYHTRAGFNPVFDMDDSINQQPDPDLIDQVEGERLT
jgi:hypothetical protein